MPRPPIPPLPSSLPHLAPSDVPPEPLESTPRDAPHMPKRDRRGPDTRTVGEEADRELFSVKYEAARKALNDALAKNREYEVRGTQPCTPPRGQHLQAPATRRGIARMRWLARAPSPEPYTLGS